MVTLKDSLKNLDIDVSIVHDYLIQMGGAEQVVASLHRLFPSAPIYTSAISEQSLMEGLRGAEFKDTPLSRIPHLDKLFKPLFPLYPALFKLLPTIESDVALISSSGFSKWIRWSEETLPVCYCYTPPRFFWNTDTYLEKEIANSRLRALARRILGEMQHFDKAQAQRIPNFIAISNIVKDRIASCYGIEAEVIYPPVFIDEFAVSESSEDFYLIASRLVAYKRIDLVVEAFRENGRRLVIIGAGPDMGRLKNISQGASNIEFRGWATRHEVIAAMQTCRALVFPGLEDFGITPLEANACGKPVLAYAGGGALETLPELKAGYFFEAQHADALNDVLPAFEKISWNPVTIRQNADRFSEQHFHTEIADYLGKRL